MPGRAGNKMPKIPTFADEQEAADWFATHDTAPYMGELEEVRERIPVVRSRPTKKLVGVRMNSLTQKRRKVSDTECIKNR